MMEVLEGIAKSLPAWAIVVVLFAILLALVIVVVVPVVQGRGVSFWLLKVDPRTVEPSVVQPLSRKLKDEKEAYEVLSEAIKQASRLHSTTIAGTDSGLDELHAPVRAVRDDYFTETESRIRDKAFDLWREIRIISDPQFDLYDRRRMLGSGKYFVRIVNLSEHEGEPLPLISFSLVEKIDGGNEVVAGWHRLIFSQGDRMGVFLHSRDPAVCNLFLDYFETLWTKGEAPSEDEH